MPEKIMFRLKSEIGQERQWRYAMALTRTEMPEGVSWLQFVQDNGDTLLCHQSAIDCIILKATHQAA